MRWRLTYRLGILFLIAMSGAGAAAMPGESAERVEIFATCSGRMAALATRQRALNEPDANGTAEMQALFDMLVEATLPDALAEGIPARAHENWRNDGWSEMATLLADVDYSIDMRRVNRARITLQTRLETCRALVL